MNNLPTFNFVCGECSSRQEIPVDKLSFGFSSEYCEEHGSHYSVDMVAKCENCEAINLACVRDDATDGA